MLIRGTKLWENDLPIEAFIAPVGFDFSSQEVNIYQEFLLYQNDNKRAIFSINVSQVSTILTAVSNGTYVCRQTVDGVVISNSITSGTFTWTVGSTNKYVIYIDNNVNPQTLTVPAGAIWLYIVRSPRFTHASNTLKYVHVDKVSSIVYVIVNNMTALTGELSYPYNATTFQCNGCNGLTGTLYIPDAVSGTLPTSFNLCTGFTGLRISENITSVNNQYFSKWTQTFNQDLIIPFKLTYIYQAAFYLSTGFKKGLTITNPATQMIISPYHSFSGCTGFTALNLPVGFLGNGTAGHTFNFSNAFSAASLNQSILNLPDNFGSFIIGATNKTRLTNAFPSAVTNAAARGITIT